MAVSHHQPQQTPTHRAGGPDLGQGSLDLLKRLLEQQSDSGCAIHAITAPRIKPLQ
jgi:hypothetical protein